MLAIITFPPHPLLGKMLKILKHGSDKKAPGPAFTIFLVVQPTMLSEHMCTPAKKVHSHAEAKPPSHMHANILSIAFHIYIHEREWLLIFLACLSLTWLGIKVMLLSGNESGSTLTFFSVLWKKMCKIRVVTSLKVSGRIHTWIHFSLKFSLLECVHYGFTIFIWQRNILFLGDNFSGCGFQIIFSIHLSFHNY